MDKTDIKSLNIDELTELVKRFGEPAFRASQIFEWLHKKHVASFEEMTNLSNALRKKLSDEYEFVCLEKVECL